MSTISASTTSTTAYKVTADTTGTLVLQTGSTPTTAVTIDTSQNVGVGVTPSAWSTTYSKAIQLPSGALSTYQTIALNMSQNTYFTNSGFFYKNNGFAERYEQYNGTHAWYTAASGTADNAISFTQAMTLDANGNLGIATTSPSTYGKLAVRAGITVSAGSTSLTGTTFFSSDAANSSFWISHSSANTNLVSDSPLTFWGPSGSGVEERARIDSSGNLMINTKTARGRLTVNGPSGTSTCISLDGWGNGIGSAMEITAASSLNADVIYFNVSTGNVGKIAVTSSSTSYVTSSDYRLKENIAPMTGALAKVAVLKPCTYTWKQDGSEGEGFIAHELQEIVPQCVTGEKDEVKADGSPLYQGIDTSFLVATLTAAIQEQQAIIEQLRADVETLKGAA